VAERDTARAQRDQAEKARAAAESARRAEEERAASVSRVRSDEEKRAAAAAAARGREERAAALADEKRVAAEAARQDAEQALAKVQAQRAEAERAEKDAASRKRAADQAVKEAEQLAAQKGQQSEEFKRAEARARQAAAEQRAAESALADRRAALADEEKRAEKARGNRDRLTADAASARKAADEARVAREEEERKKARVAREREAEEKKLAEARSAREREEDRLASAERSRRDAEARAEAARRDAESARAAAVPPPAPASRATTVASEPVRRTAVRVANVDFVDREQHARVVVALSGAAEPQIIAQGGRQAILSIDSADIPRSLERSLDTSEFDGPVKAVSSYRDPRDPTRVRVVVDLSEPAQARLSRAGNTWYWDFAKPVATARRSKKPAKAHAVAYDAPVVGGYGAASTPVTAQTVAQKKKIYRGKRIDLDFKDADLHNLLRLLAQVGDVNIVIPDGVRATVTVRLTDVPWDQAMEVILQSKDLWYRREGRLIRIAPRKVLDAEDEEERARKKAMIQEEAPEPVVFTLNYSVAGQMARQVQPLLSPKGKIEVDERTNSLIINDIRVNRGRVIALLSQLDTQTPQIQIEARVVEARSSWSRDIGVQWGLGGLASAAGGNPTGLVFPSTVGVFGGATDASAPTAGLVANPDFAVNLPAAVGTGAGGALGFTFGSVGGNFNLTLRLTAAEDTGTVRIISAPRITVLNNVSATISQGVSIPISVVSASGVSTQFVQADLKLQVTPHVSQRDCSIQLDVEVTKNEADFVNTGARGDPSILRKEAKTTMLIADGETTVIGGIYTRNSGKATQKVPFFGDIPILGYFFRFQRESDERTEVLIFLSPKITNKASLRCEARAQE
jgi:type IV pilus assembly protein PilQ